MILTLYVDLKKIMNDRCIVLMKNDLDKLCRDKKHNKILKHYRDNSVVANNGELCFKATYVEKLTRFGTKNIIESRCMLFPCKSNFSHMNRGKIECRWCKDSTKHENETHIFRECKHSPICDTSKIYNFFSTNIKEILELDKLIKNYYLELRKRGERF